jgi:dipeptidyl aminopeptidase/acylaminoacyl peptidase
MLLATTVAMWFGAHVWRIDHSLQERDEGMTAEQASRDLEARAESYFGRSSFASPVYVGNETVAFLDDRSGTPQVSLLDVATGEISSKTSYAERVQTLKGNARSGRILFGMDQGGNERQQLWTFDERGEAVRLTDASQAIHEPGCLSRGGDYVLFRSNARDESTFDVVGMSLDGGDQEIWLEDGGQVSPVDLHPDGARALVVRLNGNLDADLLLVSRDGSVRNLTEHDGEQWIHGATFDQHGNGVWIASNLDRDMVALMYLDLDSGELEVVVDTDWDVELFKIAPDGNTAVVSTNEDGISRAMMVTFDGTSEPVELGIPDGVIDGFSWSHDGKRVVFGFSSVEHPSVLMAATPAGEVETIASAGSDAPETFAPELIRYTSFDGLEIPAFFFRPPGDGPFPVLVDIPGGPESQRRLNYSPSGPVLQYLTSLGMAVLSLNVRGSTGYGKEYSHLDDKGKRLDAVKDVEYAVKWLRERDDVDASRIAVYGRSYGGFMTLASLVFYPDLWAAGVNMVGIANFVSFLERTGPWRRTHREAEYGELANDREMLERISPLTHIHRIRVPLMVVHGEHDPRVPLFEAEQVVQAVREQGQEVELLVFDNEGHAISKRPNVIRAFVMMGQFLGKHLSLLA